MNFKTIIEAWIIANNPSDRQIKLSEKRMEICNSCPSRKQYIKKLKFFNVCSECGCPILKKIFTNEYNSCPLGKWENSDKDFFPKQKINKTII